MCVMQGGAMRNAKAEGQVLSLAQEVQLLKEENARLRLAVTAVSGLDWIGSTTLCG